MVKPQATRLPSGRHRRRPEGSGEQRPAVALVEWYWARRRSMQSAVGPATAAAAS